MAQCHNGFPIKYLSWMLKVLIAYPTIMFLRLIVRLLSFIYCGTSLSRYQFIYLLKNFYGIGWSRFQVTSMGQFPSCFT